MPSYMNNYVNCYLLFLIALPEVIFSTLLDLKIDYDISNVTSSGIEFETCLDLLLI